VNLSARRTRAHGWLNDTRAELAERFSVEVCFPRDVEESLATARAASAEGAVVIAAGGDGTISVVAHGLSDRGGTLGIIPLGTANDLARALRVPRDTRAAARLIQGGTVHRTDLVSVNGRNFITVGGLGLVSRSTIDVARIKSSWARGVARMAGPAIYKIAAAGTMLQRRITGGVRVTWRDPDSGAEHVRELDVHGMFVTNHNTCGGGLVIPTSARADDGVFELALIPATTRARLLVNLSRLSAGLPLAPGVLSVLRADRALIETEHEDVFVADGDALETGHSFTLEAHRGAVGVLR
jgi:diacylglycerol kinase (ATP)